MQIRIKAQLILLFVFMAVSGLSTAVNAQSSIAADQQPRAELALSYTFVRGNAPPGFDGDFNLHGGSATFAWPLGHRHFSLVGDVSVAHGDGIAESSYDLTLTSYTAGIRYSPIFGHSRLQPFAQILAGGAHASGSLVDGPNSNTSNAGAAFAANAGGGLDLGLSPHLALRVVEADYFVTTFDNTVNDHQNNLRLDAGVVFHF